MAATHLMKLIAPMLLSSRTSITLSMLKTGRNPVIQTAALLAPTSTALGNPSHCSMTYCHFAIAHTKTTINIAWPGTAMMTAKITTQAEIAITVAKVAAIQTKIITVIDVTIIVTRKAKEATVMMTGKKEIAIVLITKASHTMWRKSTGALAPDLRVTAKVVVTPQATVAFQCSCSCSCFALCQTTASEVMTITMWRTPTWT
eukprot:825194-Ditylum_brightwellii.AAC.1